MELEDIIITNIRKYAVQRDMPEIDTILYQLTNTLLLPIAEDIISQMKKEGYLDKT